MDDFIFLKKKLKNAHKQIKKKREGWDFKRYKITAFLDRHAYVLDDIYLDGLIHHEYQRYYLGPWVYNFSQKNYALNFSLRLPIKKAKHGVYLSSRGKFSSKFDYVAKYRKRFDETQAEKWVNPPRGKIKTSTGKFKNMDNPMIINLSNSVSWVTIGDKESLMWVVNRISSIGKKKAQGNGLIREWVIEETEEKGERLFPLGKKKRAGKEIKLSCYKPSYHNMKNEALCYYDSF